MKKHLSKICLAPLWIVLLLLFLFTSCGKEEPAPEPAASSAPAAQTAAASPSVPDVPTGSAVHTLTPTAASNTVNTPAPASSAAPSPTPATKKPTQKPTTTKTPAPTSTPVRTPTPTPQKTPVPVSYGLDITNKSDLVSICYSTWFNPIVAKSGSSSGIYNITEILAGNAEWGPVNAFHFWGEPALGYYRSDDQSVIRTHMTQLAEAGVDFIIIDNTNAQATAWGAGVSGSYWDQMVSQSCKALLDTILQMREEGKQTPYVVFWNRVDAQFGWATPTRIYQEFYKSGKYRDCWVYWDGAPLMLVNMLNESGSTDVRKFAYRDEFTLRQQTVAILSGPLARNEWTFLYDGSVPCRDADGNYEQISVYVARQSTYMSNTATALGRRGGETFYKQWKRAFQYHPKVVTLTWWNEWAAQRFVIEGVTSFTDNYNQEYSRDIEPMKGGHGDQYYQWMKQYIAAYKAHQECPYLVEK